jgi:hypothetical protein
MSDMPTIKIAANGCQNTRDRKHEWDEQCLVCGYFMGEHPEDHLPQTTKACYRCGRLRYAVSLYPALPIPDPHKPGDNHDYRIECVVCGERGVLQLSVEPQRSAQ